MDYQGREAQDGHLTFTQLLNSVISGSVQFSVALRPPQKP